MGRALQLCIAALLVGTVFSAMVLESPEFKSGELIPGDYGCDIITGEDRDPYKPSPPLVWYRPPAQTQSFVLLVDDIDTDGFVHWLVVDIPRDVTHIDTDASQVAMPEGSTEMGNSYGARGWGGPCPVASTHTYRFRLFALDIPSIEINLPVIPAEIRSDFITAQIGEHALYVAVTYGTYTVPPPSIPVPPIAPIPPGRSSVPLPPIPIVRYFKPSESLKKPIGKSQGVYENNTKIYCLRGELSAQLCKRFVPEVKPEVVISPYFPPKPTPVPFVPPVQEINAPKEGFHNPWTISTGTYPDLSEEEKAKRHVRPGGLEPINSPINGVGLVVPAQEQPNINAPYDSHPNPIQPNAYEDSKLLPIFRKIGMPGPSTPYFPTDVPCITYHKSSIPGEIHSVFLEEDFTVVEDATKAVETLTNDLEEHTKGQDCNCHKGFIPHPQRRYSLTVHSPIFNDLGATNMPAQFICDLNSPSVRRQSPPIVWGHSPPAARSFVLVMDDVTDEDSGEFGQVYWIVTNIPSTVKEIPLGASGTDGLPHGATELKNSLGELGYTAPCPRDYAVHQYRIRLYALTSETAELKLSEGYNSKKIDEQLRPIVTASMAITYSHTPPAGGRNVVAIQQHTNNIASVETSTNKVSSSSEVKMMPVRSFFPDLNHQMMNGNN